MTGRTRAIVAGIAVLAVVLALGRSLRTEPPAGPRVATFESFLDGESLRRGAFEEGERVNTPVGGQVRVVPPGGGQLVFEERTDARFVTFSPLAVDLTHGRVRVETADEPLSLRYLGHTLRVGPRAVAELSSAPPRAVVISGPVTLDGHAVTGERPLAAR
ncbi:MAG: hypothetical protein KC593_18475 [Myxococcales bacterium]|nr:hypothetical protein [Myxococcales bacterium]MCB9628320.1 hypothetical protein [Sandaracinaceae bacterium]